MNALLEHRTHLIISYAFVAAVTIYAAVAEGLLVASAFLPVFVGMWLTERKRNQV
jgi:hypothetical protein